MLEGRQSVSQIWVAVGTAISDRPPQSGRIEARIGLRMMPTFPRPSLSFRTAGFPRYGWKVGLSDGAFPDVGICTVMRFAEELLGMVMVIAIQSFHVVLTVL
jgi:hypothetical protein